MAQPTLDQRIRLSGRDVVVEAFPDETVAVNLATGRYYSLDLASAAALELVTSGQPLGDVVSLLATNHGVGEDVVAPAVLAFVEQLLTEELAVVSDAAEATPLPAAVATGTPFVAPTLAVYSDMEDLLLLDPIHDVDETGWPVRADEPGPPGA